MSARHISTGLLFVALALASTGAASGQKTEACCPYYDPANEVTILGLVEQFDRTVGQSGVYQARLVVNQKEELFDVYLGPAKFVKKLGLEAEEGESVMIVGALQEPSDGAERREIVARVVAIGDEKFELRDEDGRPLWRQGRTTSVSE